MTVAKLYKKKGMYYYKVFDESSGTYPLSDLMTHPTPEGAKEELREFINSTQTTETYVEGHDIEVDLG